MHQFSLWNKQGSPKASKTKTLLDPMEQPNNSAGSPKSFLERESGSPKSFLDPMMEPGSPKRDSFLDPREPGSPKSFLDPMEKHPSLSSQEASASIAQQSHQQRGDKGVAAILGA